MSAERLLDLGRQPVNGGLSSVAPARPTPRIIRHLALALPRHVRQLRRDGLPVPAEVDEWVAFLTQSVRVRPEQTVVDDDLGGPQPASVVARLLVTKAEAAERLSVSERTIERLVAAGRLPIVHVERAARIRVSDLEAFVHRLSEGRAPQQVCAAAANARPSASVRNRLEPTAVDGDPPTSPACPRAISAADDQ